MLGAIGREKSFASLHSQMTDYKADFSITPIEYPHSEHRENFKGRLDERAPQVALGLSFAAQKFAQTHPPEATLDKTAFQHLTEPSLATLSRMWMFEHPRYTDAVEADLERLTGAEYIMPEIAISADGKRITTSRPRQMDSNGEIIDDISLVSKYPLFNPRQINPHERQLHYFEARIVEGSASVAIGLAAKPCPSFVTAGSSIPSVGYSGQDGKRYKDGQAFEYAERFGRGDVVGLGYLVHSGTVFFTVNGHLIGTAFTAIRQLYPCISISNGSATICVNFGEAEEDVLLAQAQEDQDEREYQTALSRRRPLSEKGRGSIVVSMNEVPLPLPVYIPSSTSTHRKSIPAEREGWFKYAGAWGFGVAGWKYDHSYDLKQQRIDAIEDKLRQSQ